VAVQRINDPGSEGRIPNSPYPEIGRPRFVPWVAPSDPDMLEVMAEAGTRLVLKSRLHGFTNGQFALGIRDLGIALGSAPEGWRNQLRRGTYHRPPRFEQLPYALKRRYRSDRDSFDAAAIRAYAEASIDSMVEVTGQLFGTLGHVVDDQHTLGREMELRFAEAAVDYFQREKLFEPAPDDEAELPRRLYATLVVDARQLTPEVIRDLVRRYGELGVDGYWVWVCNFTLSGAQARHLAHLVFALEASSARPVLLNGADRMHIAYLASGLAATSIGADEMLKFTFPPGQPPKKGKEKGKPRPRSVPRLNDTLLKRFAVAKKDQAKARRMERAFREYPCDCGHHVAGEAPQNNAEAKRHSVTCALKMVAEMDAVPNPVTWLEGRVKAARKARLAIGVPGIEPGWMKVEEAAAEIHSAENLDDALGL
jgi:hypothetical protein